MSIENLFAAKMKFIIPEFDILNNKDGMRARKQVDEIEQTIYFEKGKSGKAELSLSIWVNVNHLELQKNASKINPNLKHKSTLPYRLRHLYKILNLKTEPFERDHSIRKEVLPINNYNIDKYFLNFHHEYENNISDYFNRFKNLNGFAKWYEYLIDIESNKQFRSLWRDPYNHLIVLKLLNQNIDSISLKWLNQIDEEEKPIFIKAINEIRSLTLDMT